MNVCPVCSKLVSNQYPYTSWVASQLWQQQNLPMTPTRQLMRAAKPFLQDTATPAFNQSLRNTLETACKCVISPKLTIQCDGPLHANSSFQPRMRSTHCVRALLNACLSQLQM